MYARREEPKGLEDSTGVSDRDERTAWSQNPAHGIGEVERPAPRGRHSVRAGEPRSAPRVAERARIKGVDCEHDEKKPIRWRRWRALKVDDALSRVDWSTRARQSRGDLQTPAV